MRRTMIAALCAAIVSMTPGTTVAEHASHLWVNDDSESEDCEVCTTEYITDENGNRKGFRKCHGGKRWRYHWTCTNGGEGEWYKWQSCIASSD